jgi:hypothetical protein
MFGHILIRVIGLTMIHKIASMHMEMRRSPRTWIRIGMYGYQVLVVNSLYFLYGALRRTCVTFIWYCLTAYLGVVYCWLPECNSNCPLTGSGILLQLFHILNSCFIENLAFKLSLCLFTLFLEMKRDNTVHFLHLRGSQLSSLFFFFYVFFPALLFRRP